jgi:hypothetical protein
MRAHNIAQHLFDLREGIVEQPLPTTTTYLAPTNPIVGYFEGNHWIPTGASTASRKVANRSTHHCVGATVDVDDNRIITFESHLEGCLADILLADHSIVHIQDQASAVTFVDREGKTHRHFFDFVVTKSDGRRIAYAVKPTRYVASSGIKEKLVLIRNQNPNFADKYVLATEMEITKARVAHAQWILWARRGRNEADIDVILPLVTSLNGAVRMDDLVRASGLKGRGFCALVCLIDDGVLKVDENSSIDYRGYVRLHPEFTH